MAQEQALGSLGTSLTYSQIRLVLGCEAASVDLENAAIQTPLPVNELLTPSGSFTDVVAPEEPPF